jgi:hypothetical protein
MASLQALVYTILFLQATSNISDCYAFLGIALRSCLRMGLHRHLSHDKITPIEDETRRRVFHVIRQMDFYVSAILGFPLLLNDEDVDQPLPTEVDDEYITKETIRMPPPGTPSFFQAFNAHNELMRILARVVKDIYPLRAMGDTPQGQQAKKTFMINYSRIQAIEAELQEWQSRLPEYWRPCHDGPIEVIRYVYPTCPTHPSHVLTSGTCQCSDAPPVRIRPCPNDALQTVSPLHFATVDRRQED